MKVKINDLEDVVLRNTSNSPVDLTVLQAAVNFNDESWASLWVSFPEVEPEDVVAQLALLDQAVSLQSLLLAYGNTDDLDADGKLDLKEAAAGLSLDASSMLEAAVVAAASRHCR